MVSDLLTNRVIERFEIWEYSYCSIRIEGGYALACESWLRYAGKDGAFITNQDHGQSFGLTKPYDAANEIENRIRGKVIQSVEVRIDTGDVTLHLDDGRVELLCSSNGYENWQLYGPNGFVIVGHDGTTVKQ